MKIFIILLLIFPAYIQCFSQDSLKLLYINNLITTNESKIVTVYQEIEKNKIRTIDGKDPAYILSTYRFISNKVLTSATFIAYSINDTSLIINYYFNSEELIKVNVTSFDLNNNPSKDEYYFDNNSLINTSSPTNGPYLPSYYLKRATELLKKIKKSPIKFPD